jgi:hypothetical protein
MKLSQFFYWIFILIIPVPIFAQKDTLKPNFGINNLQFGVAQPADIYAHYGKCLVRSLNSKNPNYKKLKTQNTTFNFVRIDSTFLLKYIKIKPNCKKFYLEKELIFSKRTKIKDLISALGTPTISHLGKINSVLYTNTILNFGGFSCYVALHKGDLMETSSAALSEDLLEDYMNSKIKKLFLSCEDCKLPFYPNPQKLEQKTQLFYSSHKHYSYYKDQDSLVRLYINSGCLECSNPAYFKINFYTKKQRIKTSYILSGLTPYINENHRLLCILNKLKKGALKKKEHFYFGKHTYTIWWERKNIRSPYYISEIEHDVL